VLALAGLFQFGRLKYHCPDKCRTPLGFVSHHWGGRTPLRDAFRLGLHHGAYCIGCCWALMLLMFAAGVANLWWMAGLTALMVYEKTGRRGRRAVPVAGIALLACAALVLAQPHWQPPILGGNH